MRKTKLRRGADRERLFTELENRYCSAGSFWQRFLFLRKKYIWLAVVEGSKIIKRFLDIVGSFLLIVLFSPFFVVIPILIKLFDRGPVFYVTNRVGRWGEEFRFPKFRTMRIDAEEQLDKLLRYNERKGGKTFKIKEDPRITFLGRILRKSSLDELPQLGCVLLGAMSLVGPRPPLPSEVANYSLQERRRLDVLPGLTCFWQVSGRSEIPFEKQVKLDLEYIESQSLLVDLKILLQTIPAVLLGKGAY